ncbi:hypothetical protein PV10_01131 [Exophiala mesophila]|uniref:Uncharacterized protein n=1 Tax=Exophiala mesophila TaxID=212818 RepID=A0A0D2AEN0_EXOME|nr:uncharacterized protein PV10_01131 [Exophiala mesophila]KIV97373.1 hypothetical protein PV10_01131 [Exophiala mesophila]
MWPFTSAPQQSRGQTGPALEFSDETTDTPQQSHEQSLEESLADQQPTTYHDVAQDEESFRITGWPNERLTVPVLIRAPLLMTAAFFTGFATGSSHGSIKAGARFRAENAHRLPVTEKGWYLYHKSKNNNMMLGGMKEGFKFGSVCTLWATLFMATEEVVDRSRARIFARKDDEVAMGQRDAASTVIAAMTVAGLYSWKQRFDRFAAAGTARHALRYSLAYGLAQDVVATLQGSPPGYLQWLKNKVFPQRQDLLTQG